MPDQPSKESLELAAITLPIGDYNQMVKDSALLRQQNAALVEALRLAEKYLPIGGEACLYCDNDGEEHDYRCFVTKIRAALAPYAPADAPEKEPQAGERISEPKHRTFRDGEPCHHPGCLSHLSHPCEGCGRIGGHALEKEPRRG